MVRPVVRRRLPRVRFPVWGRGDRRLRWVRGGVRGLLRDLGPAQPGRSKAYRRRSRAVPSGGEGRAKTRGRSMDDLRRVVLPVTGEAATHTAIALGAFAVDDPGTVQLVGQCLRRLRQVPGASSTPYAQPLVVAVDRLDPALPNARAGRGGHPGYALRRYRPRPSRPAGRSRRGTRRTSSRSRPSGSRLTFLRPSSCGAEALLERSEQSQVPFWDPNRMPEPAGR